MLHSTAESQRWN